MSTQQRFDLFDSSTSPLKSKITEPFNAPSLFWKAKPVPVSLHLFLIPPKTHFKLSCPFCDSPGDGPISAKTLFFPIEWLAGDWTSPALRVPPDCCCVWAEGRLRGLLRATLSFMVFTVITLCNKCNVVCQRAALGGKDVQDEDHTGICFKMRTVLPHMEAWQSINQSIKSTKSGLNKVDNIFILIDNITHNETIIL